MTYELNSLRSAILQGPPNKKQKTREQILSPIVYGVLNIRLGTPKARKIKILLDSGASRTLIKETLTTKLRIKPHRAIEFSTCAGSFATTGTTRAEFTLPEFYTDRKVKYKMHVAKELNYDLIIGRDLLKELGIVLDFKREIVNWDDAEIQMKDINKIQNFMYYRIPLGKVQVLSTTNGPM